MKKPKNWGEDRSHQLLVIKEVPESFKELRRLLELPANIDLYQAGIAEPTFETAIGAIAAKLSIALDGDYEPDALFTMLCEAIRNRDKFVSQPHLRAPGLVNATLTEHTDNTVTLEENEDVGPFIEGAAAGEVLGIGSTEPTEAGESSTESTTSTQGAPTSSTSNSDNSCRNTTTH